MATPLDTENLRVLFGRIMQTHQLRPENVKKKMSNIAFSDKGQFVCDRCPSMWKSNYSWVTFDLINLEIVYRWRMKCKYCYYPFMPTFTPSQLESMFEEVVKFYKGECYSPSVNIGYGARRNYREPHHPDLCEKCKWGQGEPCWTQKFSVY